MNIPGHSSVYTDGFYKLWANSYLQHQQLYAQPMTIKLLA